MEILSGVYKHYKGTLVRVLFDALHSETKESLVVYVHLDDGVMWVRPLAMFMENVEVEGELVPRFKKVS